MDMQRCEQGHFYDADRFSVCPHCNPTTPVEDGYTTPIDPEPTPPEPFIDVTTDGDKTVSYWDNPINTSVPDRGCQREYANNPVVGWLVITDGNQMGRDFPLRTGKNFIGRSVDMDIMLEDANVSRDKHAIVLYDPKSNLFLVTPGDAHGLSYINGDLVLQAQQLKPYDVISLGKTQLTFVPFCGEQFNWASKLEDKE